MILRTLTAAALGAILAATNVSAQEVKRYRFAYDQPKNTGYGVVGDVFADKLKELSKGTMLIDQYPGAQLGQEPQVLQMIKSGDVDFCISSSANAATVSPQSGVMSLHFLFRSQDHLRKAIADPGVVKAVRDMIEETVQGAHVIGLATLGLRSMYGRTEVHKIDDIKGKKIRVQATRGHVTQAERRGAEHDEPEHAVADVRRRPQAFHAAMCIAGQIGPDQRRVVRVLAFTGHMDRNPGAVQPRPVTHAR